MTDQVSVRLAVVGGSQFRGEMVQAGNAGTTAMQRLQAAARGVSPAFQSVAFQATQLAGTMAGGNAAAMALAGGLGRAVSAASPFGIAAGVAVAAMAALVPLLRQGGQTAAEMAAELTRAEGSVGAVTGAMSALAAVQREYKAATEAQGGASAAAASAVVAASAREFAARKEVLAVELELLRIRNAERQSDLGILQDNLRREGEAAMAADAAFGGLRRFEGIDPTGFAGRRTMGRPRQTPNFDAFFDYNRQTRLAIQKLRAEAEIDRLALERGERLMTTDFADIGGSAGAPGKRGRGGGGGGGGGAAVNEMLKEGQKLFEQTRNAAERYAAELERLNGLLRSGAIDQDTYNRAAAALRAEFEGAGAFAASVAGQVKSSFASLFDAILEGGGKAGEVIEGLGRKLASMALQEATFRLLARFMPATFGAQGFIPLVGAAAAGAAFDGGRVTAFARGGVVSRPTLFPMRGGAGLMGEAGPEAILPLARIGGRLGVASGGGGTVFQLVDRRGADAPAVEVDRRTGPDGREMIVATVRDAEARGEFDGSRRSRYGTGPQRVRR